MGRKVMELIAFLLFIGSLGYIWITAGALDQGAINMGQAFQRLAQGIILLGTSVLFINYLGKEETK